MLVVKPGGGATSNRSQDSHHKNNQHRDRHNNGMVLLFNGNYKIVNILEEKRCNNEVITRADPLVDSYCRETILSYFAFKVGQHFDHECVSFYCLLDLSFPT